ncbi:MAG: hypothetical protein V2I45_09000 [Halieaceae bacterium]|jgi:antitoxin (DNA-binding transcriptional repressor) of toxin-antitoxin stability system|nr:hypothetical protein [Halieaceae bacterium]
MKVNMSEVNRSANQIVNRVVVSGESALIFKHGKPIAEIRPYQNSDDAKSARDFILNFEPVPVKESPESLLANARQRGL